MGSGSRFWPSHLCDLRQAPQVPPLLSTSFSCMKFMDWMSTGVLSNPDILGFQAPPKRSTTKSLGQRAGGRTEPHLAGPHPSPGFHAPFLLLMLNLSTHYNLPWEPGTEQQPSTSSASQKLNLLFFFSTRGRSHWVGV